MKRILSLFTLLCFLGIGNMQAAGTFLEVPFTNENWGGFTTQSVSGDQAWELSASYGAMITGYVDSKSNANEDWLISPALNLSTATEAILAFEHAINKGDVANVATNHTLWVSTNYTEGAPSTATWTQLTITTYPAGNNWTYIPSGDIDLSSVLGQSNVHFAFKYVSTDIESATWEIKNLTVIEGAEEPNPTTLIAAFNGYTPESPRESGIFLATDGNADNKGIATLTRDAAGANYAVNTDGVATSQAWDGADATDKYWIATFSTKGASKLTLTSKQKGSNTGPKDFKIQYKVGDGAWTDLTGGSVTVANDSYVLGKLEDLELPAAMDNKESVSLRWLCTSTASIKPTDKSPIVAGGGVNRLDAVIKASETSTPTEPTIITPASVAFGNVIPNESLAKDLTVSGANLTADIAYELTGADVAAFVINADNWTPATGGKLTITFTPTEEREYNAEIKLSSTGVENKVVALTGAGFTPRSTNANLASILVNGNPIENFKAGTLAYFQELAEIPTITYMLEDKKASAEINNGTTLPGKTTIVVTAEDGKATKTYTIGYQAAYPAGTWVETWETGINKPGYATGEFEGTACKWEIAGVINYDGKDQSNGLQSVRFRDPSVSTSSQDRSNPHYIMMKEDKANGAGTITLYHGMYSTHTGGAYTLDVSTDGGTTWDPALQKEIEEVPTAWAQTSFTVNKTGNIRIKISKSTTQVDNTSFNIDDILITDYKGTNIEDITSAGIQARIEENTLLVENAPAGTLITVYSIAGAQVAQTTETAIAIPAKGIYIVKMGSKVQKVINK